MNFVKASEKQDFTALIGCCGHVRYMVHSTIGHRKTIFLKIRY